VKQTTKHGQRDERFKSHVFSQGSSSGISSVYFHLPSKNRVAYLTAFTDDMIGQAIVP
jgi:hypothetical protein